MLLKGSYCVGEHFVDPHCAFVVRKPPTVFLASLPTSDWCMENLKELQNDQSFK